MILTTVLEIVNNFFEIVRIMVLPAVLEVVKIFVEIGIALGLFYLGYQANRIAKSNLELAVTKDERDLFYAVYTKLVDACKAFRKLALPSNRSIKDNEFLDMLEIFYEASEHARLFLPKEIENYIRDIEKKAWKYNDLRSIGKYGLSKEEKREKQKLRREISLKEHHQIFSPYLKLRAKKNW